jgi:CDP-glycerol glycerophosphotransferase (TagB/SpsB family)
MGVKIKWNDILDRVKGNIIGRSHIAREMIASDYVDSWDEAFEKYIGLKAPAYVPRERLTSGQAIKLIKKANGITVLAHPGLINNDRIVSEIIEKGIEGLEVNYYEHTKKEIKKIFYMPTWCPEYRKTFQKKYSNLKEKELEDFKSREYFQKITNFISSDELGEFLEEKDAEMDVFFHQSINPFMKSVVESSSRPQRINLLSNGSKIQQKLIEADILISDYSSVVWDFLYMNKPVIFYQFDQEKHLKTTGTYIEIPEDLFGPVTKTPRETVLEIKKLGEKDDYKEKRKTIKKKFFDYNESGNCQRMVNCILEKK